MSPTLKNFVAIVTGLIVGSLVNIGIIHLSSAIIPPPAGADLTTSAGLKASMHLFEPKHFLFPFLAHALGTFTGAFIAAWFAVSNKMRLAIGIGLFFLVGGIASVFMLPSPNWFTILDLVGAYIPMAYLAGKLSARNSKTQLTD